MNRAFKWKLIAVLLLVFIAGGMAGTFIGAAQVRHLFFHPQSTTLSDRMRRHLRVQLHLNKEQLANISPIIDKAAEQLGEIQRNTSERVRETIAQEHRDIAPYLTDEQRAKLKELEARPHHWQPFRGPRRTPPQQPQP
ncbi:MAG: hypothetical protein ABR514_06935 [Chthoniobacterales bacterium]